MSNSGWCSERLRDAVQRVDLGQQLAQRAAIAQHRQHPRRVRLHQSARDFLPDALGRQRGELARRDQRPHQRFGAGGHDEAEARGEAGDPQHAQRILGERRRDVSQHAGREIAGAAVGIDQRAVGAARHRIDRQVASREVVLERHLRRREELEPAVPLAVLALGARERVLLARLRMQEHREIAAHRPVARRQHRLRRRADDDPVAVDDGTPDQFVADGSADAVDLHGTGRGAGGGHRREFTPAGAGSARRRVSGRGVSPHGGARVSARRASGTRRTGP